MKKGKCIQCGACCKPTCKYLILTVTEDLKTLDKIVYGENIRSFCLIYDQDIEYDECTLNARKGFPFSMKTTPSTCGFYWQGGEDHAYPLLPTK